MERKPLTVRIARWSATHPWRAMALWVVFVVASIVVGNLSGTHKADSAGNVGETSRAEQLIKSGNFPQDPSVERILVSSRSGPLDRAAAKAAADDAARRLRAVPGVSDVDPAILSPDGTMLMVPVKMAGDPKTASDRVQPLLDATAAVQRDHASVRVEEVGNASITKALDATIGQDFQRAEMFSLPVTLIILLVAFGALIAAGVPLLLALSAVGSAIGLSSLASYLVPAQDSVSSVILLIGMAVGVDYSLFYLRREREERAKGAKHLDAVEIAAATSGHAVVVSGIAVIISMAGMFLAGDAIFSSFAGGSILVVAVSVLGSLTVLPALLAKLGRWVDRPRIPFLWRLTAARQLADGQAAKPRFWSAVLRPALKYPLATFVISAGALLVLAAPAFGMTLKLPGIQDVPRSTPVMQAYDRLTAAFPSTGTQHVIVVKAPAAQAGQVKAALDDLGARTASDPLFAHDQKPELTVSPDRTVTLMTVGTPYAPGTTDGVRSLDRLRGQLVPATVGHLSGAEYAVTGEIAGTTDYSNHVKEKLPLVVGFVLLLTFLVMAWTFRSVVIAVTAIALNMLSVGAAYGLLVVVFQHTWAEKLLDFRSNHGVVSWLPLFLFVVLFGLSMDYHVFVVSRIREAVRSGVPNREAVAQGITRSAGVVTSAAVVMVGVFAIFGTLSTLDMKQLGVGLASAILIDATIIRAVVLPSLMTLLGNANWWAPRFLRGRRPQPTPRLAPGRPAPEPELTSVH
ncbi:MAG: RND transporter [Actinobacteria bacterium 13_2_20CM_2_71_6]|nr:MAG: RND transporter [Actinobacteria bacterium 13_2_20CM_2_71_6]